MPFDILLLLPPFWTPQNPPLGIACLKGALERRGFPVKIRDLNTNEAFNEWYYNYFQILKESVQPDKQGNFFNIGHDVLRNHLLAHFSAVDRDAYRDLIRILVDRTFFTSLSPEVVGRLETSAADFYRLLEAEAIRLLEQEKPDILGVSTYSGNLAASLFTLKLAKEKLPRLITVMGGGIFADQLNPSSPDFEFFLEKTPYIDRIVIGEGENLFLEMLENEFSGSQRIVTLSDIENRTVDLRKAALPDFSGLDTHLYPNMSSYVSRSCPFQCAFCSETVQWGKYRRKEAPQVVRELSELFKLWESQLFLMGDSLLNPVVQDLSEEFIKSPVSIYWDGYLRADREVGNPDRVFSWRRGGFYRARLGLESGSQRILDIMGKKIILQQIKEALVSLASSGIKTTTYWVIGYPGETEEDFLETLNLLAELKDYVYEAECNPFNYSFTGQVNSTDWQRDFQQKLLYPPEYRDMLIVQTWMLDCFPSREEIYDRVRRFVAHCRKNGIPNPYSMREINDADRRWRLLHKRAVPPLVELKDARSYIDECKSVKTLMAAGGQVQDHVTFGF